MKSDCTASATKLSRSSGQKDPPARLNAAIPPCPSPNTMISLARYPHFPTKSSSTSAFSITVLCRKPASASNPPLLESKMMSSPQWKPSRSMRPCGPWTAMHAVSGRLSCSPSLVKEACLSPRPCRRSKMLVGGSLLGAVWRAWSVSTAFTLTIAASCWTVRSPSSLAVNVELKSETSSHVRLDGHRTLTWHNCQYYVCRKIRRHWQATHLRQ